MINKTIKITNKVIRVGSNYVFVDDKDIDKVICRAMKIAEREKKEFLGSIKIVIKETENGIEVDGENSDILDKLNQERSF